MTSFADRQQQLYDRLAASEGRSFPLDPPALFSPAAAAQDPGNRSATYFRWTPFFVPMEFGSWARESRAHVDACYIGDWSSIAKLEITGPEALAFLSHVGMNDLSRFEVGQIKHHVQLDPRGYVASEGIVYRTAADRFLYTGGGGDWTAWQLTQGSWDAQGRDVTARRFIFEVQGPRSARVLGRWSGVDIAALGFNRGVPIQVGDWMLHLLRTGISGELGYEVHGDADDAAGVWSAIAEAGRADGLVELGMRSQLVQHIEAGIATAGLDYLPASIGTPGQARLVPGGEIGGSFIPRGGLTDFFRYPFELGWGGRKGLRDGEFLGRDALAARLAAPVPRRRLVTLVWDSAAVVRLFADQFDDEATLAEPMDMPRYIGASYDSVVAGDSEVGVSTSRTYSPTLRRMISLGVVNEQHAAIGSKVEIVWGRPGAAQVRLAAQVASAPIKPDRRRAAVSTI